MQDHLTTRASRTGRRLGIRSGAARTLGAALAAAMLAVPARLAAQIERSCEASTVMRMSDAELAAAGALAPHHPRAVLDGLAPLLGRGEYGEAMAAVIVEARAALHAGGVPPADSARYDRRLRELDSTFALAVLLPLSDQPRFLASDVRPADFHLVQDANGNYPIFAGTPAQVVVTSAMPEARQRALCWPTITIDRLVTLFGARHRAATVQALRVLATRWENYVRNGYSQLPWELALNGLLRGRSSYEPPAQQLVFMHPSVGVEANGTVLKELRRVDVAVLEPLGWIFRYNGDYTRYLGISSAVTFGSSRNAAVGAYAHLWFPQAKVGYVVRSDPDPRRRRSVLVSVDLYDLLAGVPDQLQKARESAIGRKLLEVTGATRP